MHVSFDALIFVMAQKLHMKIKIINRTGMWFALLMN